ncbi:MAG: Imm27 family immunity protein [Desulfobacterales bacterium]
MKNIKFNEIKIEGNWVADGNEIKGDDTSKRIEWLIRNKLKEVGVSKKYGAWETLYVDPNDGRYWVRIFPKSHLHGGGPPTLENVSKDKAHRNFKFSE